MTHLKYSCEMFLEINVEKADLRIFMTRTIRPDKFQNPYTEMMAKNLMTPGSIFPDPVRSINNDRSLNNNFSFGLCLLIVTFTATMCLYNVQSLSECEQIFLQALFSYRKLTIRYI